MVLHFDFGQLTKIKILILKVETSTNPGSLWGDFRFLDRQKREHILPCKLKNSKIRSKFCRTENDPERGRLKQTWNRHLAETGTAEKYLIG